MMRIAQIAPLEESVPPKLYGGTERVVYYLTEALIEAGHQVTLFASGDSWTRAELVASWPQATRLGKPLSIEHRTIPSILMLETVLREAHRFDVIHSHIEFPALPTLSRLSVPFVSTMHNNLESPAVKQLFEAFPTAALVSSSNTQRRPLPNANWISTIYHGLPVMHLNPVQQPSLDYLAFLGRISPEKGIAQAVHIAAGAGMRLKVAAKIDPSADGPYYENEIKRMFELPHVEFIGEIGEAEKGYFLGNAKALLFPIQWEEPFGIVMVESMACGTPVIAFNRGAVVEVVEDNVSGFVVEDELQAIAAIKRLDTLPRAGVRRAFENRFTSSTMAQGYLNVYEELRERSGWCGVNGNCA